MAGLVSGCTSGTAAGTASPTASAPAPPTPTPTVAPGAYGLEDLGTFANPVWAGPAPGDNTHLYLVDRTGQVLQLDAQGVPQLVVLDLRAQVSKGNEQGLLSIAFDPHWVTNHRMYANFTDVAGNTKVVAYTVSNGTAGAGQELLSVQQPFTNHNGGLLLFDRTGMLLVGLGDGGSAGDPGNRAQDLSSDLGKILRLDPRTGAGAPGNPYPQNPRVWALGLRNPWRFSFDTGGDLYVADVGQNRMEELDVVPPALQSGANYGWSVYEGTAVFKKNGLLTQGGPLIAPALTYLHSDGGCSITGGEVYHGAGLPELDGAYLFGDYCAGKVMMTRRTPEGVAPAQSLQVKVEGLQAFGTDNRGELLVLSSDHLYRLVAGS